MTRGDLFRVLKPAATDSRRYRTFVVVSRQALVDSKFSTVVCAPVYTARYGLSTEVAVGTDEGLRHESSIHCDALVSLPKSLLTQFVGHLSKEKLGELDRALATALAISVDGTWPRRASAVPRQNPV